MLRLGNSPAFLREMRRNGRKLEEIKEFSIFREVHSIDNPSACVTRNNGNPSGTVQLSRTQNARTELEIYCEIDSTYKFSFKVFEVAAFESVTNEEVKLT